MAVNNKETILSLQSNHVLVIGTGSWGTALSVLLSRHNVPITLLCRTTEERDLLSSERCNGRFLPNVEFPLALTVDTDIERGCAMAEVILLVVPTQRMRENVRAIAPFVTQSHTILSAAKGLEDDTLLRMSEILEQELGQTGIRRIGALSGPNIAREIAAGKPATSVVASRDQSAIRDAVAALNVRQWRVYSNPDVTGVELGGALKNIIAIGAGAVDGMGAGDNAKAAFVTRGLAEIARLGTAAGANPLTFAGLAGLGDLLATVSSRNSRNRFVGQEFARGQSLDAILTALAPQIAEGIHMTRNARELASRYGVEMPIVEQTYKVMFENTPMQVALDNLMLRDATHELNF